MKTIEQVRAIVDLITYRPETKDTFTVAYYNDVDGDPSQVMYVQHSYLRHDSITGEMERGYGRKWHISPHATDSEIVLTCLKAAITNAEHEVREDFRFMGKQVFQPHIDVYRLRDAAQFSDSRPTPTTEVEKAEVLG